MPPPERNEKGNVATIKTIIILTCGIERARVDLCIRKMHLHARLLTCASLFCRRAQGQLLRRTHARWKWVNKNSFHVIPRVKRACGGRVFSLCAEHCARMNKNNLRERQMHPNTQRGVFWPSFDANYDQHKTNGATPNLVNLLHMHAGWNFCDLYVCVIIIELNV